MDERWSWEDARVFLAIARSGGLARATTETGLSAPTLGRRMTALERAVGAQLFLRRRDGYRLTGKGEELLGLAEDLEKAALRVERWRAAADPDPVVTVSAGTWTSVFLAKHLPALTQDGEDLRLALLSTLSRADLLRRQANIGLRNRRPVEPGLAARRLVSVAFAVYGATALLRDRPAAGDERRYADCDWIVFAPDGPKPPSAVWLEAKLPGQARLLCSGAQALLEAAVAGMGLCLLPCFIGDRQAGLARASEVIPELSHEQWLVTHDDDRHDAPIRAVSKRLARLIRANADLFAGQGAGQVAGQAAG